MGSFVGGDQMLPAFSLRQIADRWTFAPVATGLVIAVAALYLWGVWRVGSRHPARPWPWWRTWLFVCGLAVIVVATQSGIGAYDDVLFWDHMIQHLLLIMVAPPLLVLGQPITLLLHASRNPLHTWAKRAVRSPVAAFLTWPPFTIAAYAAVIVGTHLTSAMNVVMTNQWARDGEHALYLIAGYLFFLPLLGREPIRWRIPYPIRILVLIVAMPVDTFTGLVLGYSATGMTGMMSRSWGPSPVDDVHLGGAVMWIGGDAIMLALIMGVFLAWSRDDRGAFGSLGWLDAARRTRLASLAEAAPAGGASQLAAGAAATDKREPGVAVTGAASAAQRADRHRDVDADEEELAAYNAYLARLGEAESVSGKPPRR
ncbi:MAG TPA: cytochrome c oxidase assembly protein [Streptosporangiaceae bacterium]|nr:cytochrome c oxidase assembly protein [Streptosporangiaceae bacterium]